MNIWDQFNNWVEACPKPALYGAVGVFAVGVMAGANGAESLLTDHNYGSGAAEDRLEQAGYRHPQLLDIQHIAVDMRGCNQADSIRYEFTATASDGQQARVAVCKGLFNDATIAP